LCPFCEDKEEDFNHVWTCDSRQLEIFTLISDTKQILVEEINQFISQDTNKISIGQLNSLNFWNIELNNDSFVFYRLNQRFYTKNFIRFF
jgi:hypothetical protein